MGGILTYYLTEIWWHLLNLSQRKEKIFGNASLHPINASKKPCVIWAKVLYMNNEASQFMHKSVKML